MSQGLARLDKEVPKRITRASLREVGQRAAEGSPEDQRTLVEALIHRPAILGIVPANLPTSSAWHPNLPAHLRDAPEPE